MAEGTNAKYETSLKKRKLEIEISPEEQSKNLDASASTSDHINITKFPRLMNLDACAKKNDQIDTNILKRLLNDEASALTSIQIHKTKYLRLMMPNDFDPDEGPIDRGNTTDMEDAIKHGNLSAVKFYYLQNPNSIHQCLSDGLTPLILATKLAYDVDIVKFLVLKGADVNAMGNQDKTSPLIMASLIGNLNYVEFLLNYGANINFQNVNGRTALHTATLYEHFAIMESLKKNGADLTLRDDKKNTAFDYGSLIRIDVIQDYLKKKNSM